MLHELLSNLEDSNNDNKNNESNSDTLQEKEEKESILLVNSATSKNISLVNIRNHMSVPDRKKLITEKYFKKKVPVNKSKATALDESSDEII